ncbi:MAG: helix-turn-helix domain-containing protein [Caldilineaceae bacterium]
MSITVSNESAVVTPNAAETMLARESSHRLTTLLREQSEYQIQFVNDDQRSEPLTIPAAAMQLLAEALSEMANGHSVTLLPVQTELSTQQAANLLNVSRPYLIGLLEKGELPFHKIGTHRRLRLQDVLSYKQKVYAARLAVLDDWRQKAKSSIWDIDIV